MIGPLIGGFIVDRLNWHWVFFINLALINQTINAAAQPRLSALVRQHLDLAFLNAFHHVYCLASGLFLIVILLNISDPLKHVLVSPK